MNTWGTSSWSAGALGSAALAGQLVRLDVVYSTDPGLALRGFWFDEVALTNFDLQVQDTQTNTCEGGNSPPNAVDDAVAPGSVAPVEVMVLANDSDPDLDSLRVLAVSQPPSGSVVINSIGPNLDTVTYTPPGAGCVPGLVQFQYSIHDGHSGSDIATVTINYPGSRLSFGSGTGSSSKVKVAQNCP
jgi:hypothetical protein